MEIHDFYIFERSGKMLFQRSFTRNETDAQERGKLVYGVLFSFKQLVPSLSASDQIVEEGIRSMSTNGYTLTCFETPTGYRFALITSVAKVPEQLKIRALLERIFSELFVDLVMMDPLYQVGTKIESPIFTHAVVTLLQSLVSTT